MGGAVIFIDEIDALASSRESEGNMHEATRRVLSVLLQRLEGFTGPGLSLLVCATNRKRDLDAALVSRFDMMIRYDLPDLKTRGEIFGRYAKQLGKKELTALAEASGGLSCRDIRDVCQHAERQIGSKVVHNKLKKKSVPDLDMYQDCLRHRRKSIGVDNSVTV